MARNARRIAAPAGAKNLMNPRQQQTAYMVAEAYEHFVEHCGICHGIDGRGDTLIGKNLYAKVPDMNQRTLSNSAMAKSITLLATASD